VNRKLIARYIDHTLLKPDVGLSQINLLCNEAMTYNFHSVCLSPYFVKEAAMLLINSPVQICTVVSFPLGTSTTKIKCYEIEACLKDGANEIDMVMNIGVFKEGNLKAVEQELKEAKKNVGDKILKIIIETSLLTNNEIVSASKIVETSGADFVKTSTGFIGTGASIENVCLIKKAISPKIQIKASGGIKSLKQFEKMQFAGANRIGTSNSIIIMGEIPLI